MGPISNSTITPNIISCKNQQFITFTLLRGEIVTGRKPISTSTFTMNYCSQIARGRVDGILWPRSTCINIPSAIKRGREAGHTWPTSTTSAITWGSVAGLKRPMSKTFMSSTITWRIVDGINRPMSTTLLTQKHFNIFFFRNVVVVFTTARIRMDGLTRHIS